MTGFLPGLNHATNSFMSVVFTGATPQCGKAYHDFAKNMLRWVLTLDDDSDGTKA